MTPNDLVQLPQRMNLRRALELAFHAGAAHRLGQYKDFVQSHMDLDEVVEVLATRTKVKP